MSYRHCSIALVALLALSACDLIDPTCPEGTWRERAMEACVPIPVRDAGTIADGGALDASSDADAAAVDGAADDAAADDAAVDDAAVDDAAVDDAATSDAATSDGG